jgi:hypothetical protein
LAQKVHDESGGAGAVVAVTTAVAADVAAADPLRLLAVTMMRSVRPTSADESVNVELVAPAIAPQAAPVESQRSHWRE